MKARKKQQSQKQTSRKNTTRKQPIKRTTQSGSESWHAPAAEETPGSTEQMNQAMEADTHKSGSL